jgi:class 3 adenylate cyclase
MALKDDLVSTVAQIFKNAWSERQGNVVPESSALQLSNDAIRLDGAVLYADLAGSTKLVDEHDSKFAAEVYKAYLHCAAKVVRDLGGEITAYDGDRIMAVFLGADRATNALRCALKLNAAVIDIVNPALAAHHPSAAYRVRHGVGVDVSSLLVARTGIRGANDLAWIGPAANWAAKLSAMREEGFASYITAAAYRAATPAARTTQGREMWEPRTWNGKSIYRSGWKWAV